MFVILQLYYILNYIFFLWCISLLDEKDEVYWDMIVQERYTEFWLENMEKKWDLDDYIIFLLQLWILLPQNSYSNSLHL